MKEIILITGANGMVAKRLSELLTDEYSIRFLTRIKRKENEYEWDTEKGCLDIKVFENVKHIIHLAGAGIADKKWTKNRKKIILSSRVDSAMLILKSLKKHQIKITSFTSASAIGFYGTETTKNIYVENMRKGNDFLSDVCYKWEEVAKMFKNEKIAKRTTILRLGVVLSNKGGALKKMVMPVKLFLGSPIGSGKQFMPWIHIDDLCGVIKYSIENNEFSGIYNVVSPEHKTNKEFTKAISQVIKRPIFLPNVPKFIFKWLFGEASAILLKGSRVSSQKLLKNGYHFQYPNLEKALKNLLN